MSNLTLPVDIINIPKHLVEILRNVHQSYHCNANYGWPKQDN